MLQLWEPASRCAVPQHCGYSPDCSVPRQSCGNRAVRHQHSTDVAVVLALPGWWRSSDGFVLTVAASQAFRNQWLGVFILQGKNWVFMR